MNGMTVDSTGEAFMRMDATGGALPAREREVLHGVAAGHTNAEIGAALFLSEHTVKTYLRRLLRRLDARDRTHAVHLAGKAGLLP